MPRQGEASSGNVSDKQEWERGLFGQLLSNSTGSKTLIPVPHTPWATYTNTSWQGARTAARTGQRQRVHVNYLWKYATDCGLAEAACNLPWGILFHTNWNYRRKGERLKERTEPEPEADTGTGTAWPIVVCALQSEPARASVRRLGRVCGHTNYNSNNKNINNSSPDVPYASVDEAL